MTRRPDGREGREIRSHDHDRSAGGNRRPYVRSLVPARGKPIQCAGSARRSAPPPPVPCHEPASPRDRRPRAERNHQGRPAAHRRSGRDRPVVRRRGPRHRGVHPRRREAGARRRRYVLHPHPRPAGPARRAEALPRRALRDRPPPGSDHRARGHHDRAHHRRPDGAEHRRPRDHRGSGMAEHRQHVPYHRGRGGVRTPAADGRRMAPRPRRRPRRATPAHPGAVRQHPLQPHRLGDAARSAGRASGALPGAQHPPDRRRGLPPQRVRWRRRAVVPVHREG